jgi:uncharacterized small protein (DUF1192 family)
VSTDIILSELDDKPRSEPGIFLDDAEAASSPEPEPAPSIDELFAGPPPAETAAVEEEPQPIAQQPTEDAAARQIAAMQAKVGERDERIRKLNVDIERTLAELAVAKTAAAAAAEAVEIAGRDSVKIFLQIEASGDFLIRVPKALRASLRPLRAAVTEAEQIHKAAQHQPLLRIKVEDISTQQPTPPAALPPKRRRKKFLGIF